MFITDVKYKDYKASFNTIWIDRFASASLVVLMSDLDHPSFKLDYSNAIFSEQI